MLCIYHRVYLNQFWIIIIWTNFGPKKIWTIFGPKKFGPILDQKNLDQFWTRPIWTTPGPKKFGPILDQTNLDQVSYGTHFFFLIMYLYIK